MGPEGPQGPTGEKGDKGDPGVPVEHEIVDVASIRGSFFSTTSIYIPEPTGNQVTVECPETCLLLVGYYADTRNQEQATSPQGYYNFHSIFIDGVDQAVFASASFPVPGVSIPLALSGLFPVAAGTHTVEVYAYVNGGLLESHWSGMTVQAIAD
jgi:hypothetical protein